MYALGVIGGYSDGSFNGGGIMNRGQAAAVIYRMTQAVPVEAPAPEPPAVPAPETPEAPAPETPSTPAAGTLTNGKPITVENVTELMNELRAQYPNGTDAGRYNGPAAIRQITTKYSVDTGGLVSTSIGCGGWAARVFDYIFGQDVTFRRVSYDEARVGDLLIKVDSQGRLMHVAIVSARKTINGIPNMLCTTDANVGNSGVNVMLWDGARYDPIKYGAPWTYDIYTVYPD